MSETIVRRYPFIPSRPAGGYRVVSADGRVLATGTEAVLRQKLEFFGEGARVERTGKR